MRNASSQRGDTMIRVGASQQPSKSHVSHAEIGGGSIRSNAGAIGYVVGRTVRAVRQSSCAAVPDWKILPKPRTG